MSPPRPTSSRDLTRRAAAMIAERLPSSWKSDLREELGIGGRLRADGVLELEAPDGVRARVVIETKRGLETRDVAGVAAQLDRYLGQVGGGDVPARGLVAAPYINPGARERLAELDLGYADATGNIRLELNRPALFLRDAGADSDPWRGPGRPRGSFKGGTAARVFRALADFRPPYSVPQLVSFSDASTGVAYRVVEFLEREGLVARDAGTVTEVRWRQLIERWSLEYGFALSRSTSAFMEPRGVEAAIEKLRAGTLRYALTSSSAAQFYAPYAPVRALSVYVTSVDEAVDVLGLRPAAGGGGNVILAVPEDEVAFARAREFEGLNAAAPSQTAADLLGAPGRAPEEGRVLLDWMEQNEPAWRT